VLGCCKKCWTSVEHQKSSPRIKDVYICGCLGSYVGHQTVDVGYAIVVQCLVFGEQVQTIV